MRKKNRVKGFVVIPGEGIPCPRCRLPTEIREHRTITEKHLNQPYYFSRWFFCRNPKCVVSLHMAEKFKVKNPARRTMFDDATVAQASNSTMTVIPHNGAWAVEDHGTIIASGFETNAKAWRWVDRRMNEPVGRKEAAHDWSAMQWLRS